MPLRKKVNHIKLKLECFLLESWFLTDVGSNLIRFDYFSESTHWQNHKYLIVRSLECKNCKNIFFPILLMIRKLIRTNKCFIEFFKKLIKMKNIQDKLYWFHQIRNYVLKMWNLDCVLSRISSLIYLQTTLLLFIFIGKNFTFREL